MQKGDVGVTRMRENEIRPPNTDFMWKPAELQFHSSFSLLTDVLMVTTTVGMLDGVHSNTTNLRSKKLFYVDNIKLSKK